MTSRERVWTALTFNQPDRVPVDFDGTTSTGMHVSIVSALRDYYGLEKRLVKIYEPMHMLGLIEDDLKEVLGVDTQPVPSRVTTFGYVNENWKEYRLDDGLEVLVAEGFNTTKDSEGNTYIYPQGDVNVQPSGVMPKNGYYFDAIVRQPEIDDDQLNYEDNIEEFCYFEDEDIKHFNKAINEAAKSGRSVLLNLGGMGGLGDVGRICGTFLKHPKGIRDIEEWLISTVTRQGYIHMVFEAQTEIAVENLKRLYPIAKDKVDVVFICGADFGTQRSVFCSPDTFRELYLPYYKKMNDWIHENTHWKTFKHTCGAIEPLLPLFIEAGFDIINPVQCSADGMEPEKLKKKYGKNLVFWGGGVDTQKTLPFGTPQQVREEVLRRCEIFSKGGGFVFSSIHNVQPNTPVENIAAMIEAVKEFR